MVNGKAVKAKYAVKVGDVVTYEVPEEEVLEYTAENIPLDIIYEDEYILAVNKPINMPSHPSHGHFSDTLANGVVAYYNKIGLSAAIHIITRLDRNTSGVVLFAKDAYVHDLFSRLLREGNLHKEYIALCEGEFFGEGVIDAPIARTNDSIITRCISADGVNAVTQYETICSVHGNTVVRLNPQTGRTHQLRVHMSYLGHPMVGDDLYGAKSIPGAHHCLHAEKLTFIHPITKEYIELFAQNNNDWGNFGV